MTTITTVTTPATRADDLTPQDYRDIYDELRERLSLAEFVARIGSQVSRSWWSQYEAGSKSLNWQRKNELRAAVLPTLLAPDVADALTAVTPAATVYRVGEGLADRVILVTPAAHSGLLLSINGDVHMLSPVGTLQDVVDAVTPVTNDSKPRRPTCFRPRLALDLATRITQLEALLEAAKWEVENPPECPLCGRTDNHIHDGDTLR